MYVRAWNCSLCSMLAVGAFLMVAVPELKAQVAAIAEHDVLKQGEGTWDATVKVWLRPDAPPVEFTATEKNELIGGIWLTSRLEANVLEYSIVSITTLGYDPAAKQYVGTFIVNLEPHLTITTGSYDAETKTLTMSGNMRNPASGEIAKTETTSRMLNDHTLITKIYFVEDDGNDWKLAEIQSKRRK